ncbi:MAG: hypothetical protein GF341_03165 [candidate division Zixibacteria bacterium]|nr:hypothetical protein [candidate division Zixibacteria bacterium]
MASSNLPHGPSAAYRRLFVAMTNAISEGDLTAATRSGKAALKIAVDQHWLPMQVVVFQALGIAYLADQKPQDALDFHRQAVAVAQQAEAEEDPAGPKLVVQTRLSGAAVLFGERKYKEAGAIYEDVAPRAEELDELIVAMECWRMAAYCREQTGFYDKAWEFGCQALNVGEKLEEDIRTHSTLPYAGQALLDLTKRHDYAPLAKTIRKRMADLCGPDWEEALDNK